MRYASRKARRYAEALFALADEQNRLEESVGEIRRVAVVLEELPDLAAVLAHRAIPLERKLELARQAFAPAEEPAEGQPAPALSELMANFLRLVIDHGRVALLPEIRVALEDMLDERQGVVRATVTTAVPIVKGEREMIEAKLVALTGAARVALETKVSRSILGGVIIHVGDHVIDASVRTYLASLRETLRRVRVSEFDSEGFLDLNLQRLREQAQHDLGG